MPHRSPRSTSSDSCTGRSRRLCGQDPNPPRSLAGRIRRPASSLLGAGAITARRRAAYRVEGPGRGRGTLGQLVGGRGAEGAHLGGRRTAECVPVDGGPCRGTGGSATTEDGAEPPRCLPRHQRCRAGGERGVGGRTRNPVTIFYADTSALVRALFVDEPDHVELRRLLLEGETPVVTRELTRVELASAVAAAAWTGRLQAPGGP